MKKPVFDPNCNKCPRLVALRSEVKEAYPAYHAAPVVPFGATGSNLLIVGLAPGLHGANATGRPFTGDYAGLLLYKNLFEFGFSTKPESIARDDGLELLECAITNAVKCLPPKNKPLGAEVATCNKYLQVELAQVQKVILALGHIAHNAVLRGLGVPLKTFKFGHNNVHALSGNRHLVDSYHCSRYNMNTGRLTEAMFRNVFQCVARLIDK